MKGISNAMLAVILIAAMLVSATLVGGLWYAVSLAAVPAAVEYNGEFDDAYLATKGWFYSDFAEETDCNITSDVLGGSSYTSCIYKNSSAFDLVVSNATDMTLSLVLDIDGGVENMEVDAELQNTGTLKAADDMVIKDAKLYTYDDSPTLIKDLSPYIEDHTEIDGETGPLAGDEYVLYILMRTKALTAVGAAGDDLLKIDLDLTTTEDVDAARITVEIA